MPKEAMIRARVESDLKAEVEDILRKLGLTTTEAITLFYQQVRLNQGLPFQVRIPNRTTIRAFEDADAGRNLTRYKDVREMFDKLGL